MTTRQTSITHATGADHPGLVAPSRPPVSVSPTELLPGYRPYFVLLAHPAIWTVCGGLIVPDLARVEALPGVGGNGPSDNRYPAGAIASCERRGFRRIPDHIQFRAWGVLHTEETHPHGTYRDWYESDDPHGRGIWAEAWMRPRVLAGTVRWRIDDEGHLAFLRAVISWLLDGREPADDQVDIALLRPLETARDYASRASNPQILMRLHQLLRQIPRNHIPPDIVGYYPDAST